MSWTKIKLSLDLYLLINKIICNEVLIVSSLKKNFISKFLFWQINDNFLLSSFLLHLLEGNFHGKFIVNLP